MPEAAGHFPDQGGAAASDPNWLVRWLTSRLIIRRLVDPKRQRKRWCKLERKRLAQGLPHRVDFYLQLDDPYSYLATQLLGELEQTYKVEVRVFLVSGPNGNNAPEPELLAAYARQDAARVAPTYGLEFPLGASPPSAANIELATAVLAQLSPEERVAHCPQVCAALWQHSAATLRQLAEGHGRLADPCAIIEQGNRRQRQRGHYAGAMFHYGGEWYWGVDRLYLLESRLREAGMATHSPMLVPRPAIETGPAVDTGSMTLEIFVSLRSPYTAVIFDRAVQLAKDTGVNWVLRPVLPMVMRGVPFSRQKALYMFKDAMREASARGDNWGNFYDPIGEPVRRAFSLYPWAEAQGRAAEFIGAFLRAAFAEGVYTGSNKGIRYVVEKAGLDWAQALTHLDSSGWQQQLEENRLAMYGFNCWGVPSFRLLGAQGNTLLSCWGQDRLWLVAQTIQSVLTEKTQTEES